jgi:hypothetical protein
MSSAADASHQLAHLYRLTRAAADGRSSVCSLRSLHFDRPQLSYNVRRRFATTHVTDRSYSAVEKDAVLRRALTRLTHRFPASTWLGSDAPWSALRAECAILASEPSFRTEFGAYLSSRTIVRRAIQAVFTHMAMAARARWDSVAEEHRGIAARGWFLGRWLPTFLVIDGPVGRMFMHESSPLARRLGPSYPILAAARDLMADKTFRSLRNGFAHWGFDWEVVGKDSYVVAYDWERDLPTAKLHLEEADAFHICAFALIEVVDEVLVSERAFRPDAA